MPITKGSRKTGIFEMKNNKGFTLIEVLISMVVLAVGLLGLAGLQATGIRNNLSAYHRSQATMLAYDMADRMRANLAEAGNLAASTYNTSVMSPLSAVAKPNCKQVSGTCTPAQMAENDLNEWNSAIGSMLPLGTGQITSAIQGAGANQFAIFTVTINWDDNRDGSVDGSDPSFAMSFQL